EKRVEAWHETHNIWLQVAAELGIFGLAVFAFLMARAVSGVLANRQTLARVRAAKAAAKRPTPRRRPIIAPDISEEDAQFLDAHSAARAASLAGFFVCSFFSSVAYTWTFYYLLVLAVAPRDILRARLPLTRRRRAVAVSEPAPWYGEPNGAQAR